MRRRFLVCALTTATVVALAACGSSPPAPPVGEVVEACADTSFCMGMPTGWAITDVGDRHVTIEHEAGSDATIGFVQMARVIASAGGAGPQTPERVTRAMWALFDGGTARLDEVTVDETGAVRSVGEISTGMQYHLLIPLDDDDVAVSIVVRAPSRSWRPHVDAIFNGFELR